MNARNILLLAAEDAFEFERFREAGPLTADIDPEATAAEIVEFEALGIPMPSELESQRRELEHAPMVREAMRNAAIAMRRSGRASASALVALGPQHLVPVGAYGFGPGADPRFMAMPGVDPRMAGVDPRMAGAATPQPPGSSRERRVATAAVIGQDGTVDADVLDDWSDDYSGAPGEIDADDFDELDDYDERPRPPKHARRGGRAPGSRGAAKGSRRRRPDYDDYDDYGDDDSLIAAAPPRDDKTTWILGGVAAIAVLALLWVAFGRDEPQELAAQGQPADPSQAVAQAPPPAPPLQAVPAPLPAPVDPAAAQPLPAPAPAPAPRGRGRSGGGGGSKPSAPATAGGKSSPINPFGGYTPPPGGGTQPAPAPAPGTQPAPAPTPGGGTQPAPAPGTQPAPAPAPAPEPATVPEEPQLVKQKMTQAQRGAITQKVGGLQQCYTDALVGKPDLAGRVVFTISLDQDGVVKRVDIAKDQVKFGVAKCAAKKIRSWTLPSGGIPMIFDLPFDFKQ